MSKRMRFSIVAIAALIATLGITPRSIAQTGPQSTTRTADPSLLDVIFIHGYTGYLDDLPYCFVRDNPKKDNRPLYFNVYSNIEVKNYSQVGLELYSYETGAPVKVEMTMGKDDKVPKDWYVKYFSGNMFTIEIVKDAKPPHLGPGPYVAVISVSPMVKGVAQVIGRYRYGTWSKSPFECGYLP